MLWVKYNSITWTKWIIKNIFKALRYFNVQQLFVKRLLNFQLNSWFKLFVGFLVCKWFMSCSLETQCNAVFVGYWSLMILLYLFYESLKVLLDSLTGKVRRLTSIVWIGYFPYQYIISNEQLLNIRVEIIVFINIHGNLNVQVSTESEKERMVDMAKLKIALIETETAVYGYILLMHVNFD